MNVFNQRHVTFLIDQIIVYTKTPSFHTMDCHVMEPCRMSFVSYHKWLFNNLQDRLRVSKFRAVKIDTTTRQPLQQIIVFHTSLSRVRFKTIQTHLRLQMNMFSSHIISFNRILHQSTRGPKFNNFRYKIVLQCPIRVLHHSRTITLTTLHNQIILQTKSPITFQIILIRPIKVSSFRLQTIHLIRCRVVKQW